MQCAAATDIGCLRDENQDRVFVQKFGECILAAVFDGMGGERAGEEASRIAEEEFLTHFKKSYRESMDTHALRNLMISSVSAANTVIYTTARMNYRNFGMGTTCVAAFIDASGISVVNVGDSRAYYYAGGTIRLITTDHTVVNMLLEHGRIRPEEIATHPQRHMLTRAVGVEKTVRPDYFRLDRRDEKFHLLLCSDGLSGYCGNAELAHVLEQEQDVQGHVDQLIQMALDKGGRDNVSVALVSEP
ncbi:MAG: Stp1/IreP family PP2C-type Ser/Thr phosphatase [Ruminococcus sp.]|nr:Stp1/IreP family PP2C-type Ser/Thr phosphatase [Ruminococcus sp.]